MKRAILLLIALMILGGCAHTVPKSYWTKGGERVSSERAQREFQKCLGPLWAKNGMILVEYENDYNICAEADLARDRHIANTKTTLAIAQLLTLGFAPVSVAVGIAGMSIPSNSDYFKRCMKAKGYVPAELKKEEAERCMKDKGYDWKEER